MVPGRIAYAVDLLDVRPGDRILEIGCGPGVALELVARRLGENGQVTGIDRSEVAVARALDRLAGRAQVVRTDLAGFDGGPFDKAFAVNVNVFWTGPADPECAVLRRILRPGGVVHLVYDSRSARGLPTVQSNLDRHGFTTKPVTAPASVAASAVTAQR